MIKLDYTLESPEERKALVEKIIAETPEEQLTSGYLEILANYLILCMEKQERKERKILTENRMSTVNRRECSFEGLAGQFENGEDGIYNLINENKNVIFYPKISITEEDLKTIPLLKQLKDTINVWEAASKRATGKTAYLMKKAIIEMRKDQYLIKQAYKKPIVPCKITRSSKFYLPLDDESELHAGKISVHGISFMDPQIVSAILCNYSKLKENSYGNFEGDTWYLMEAFDEIATKALVENPVYEKIVELKIDGLQNKEIQRQLQVAFGLPYTPEYISALWRKKIPNAIATKAKEDFLIWQYQTRHYPMKKCSKCGQVKPANNFFFSINNTSSDGWYSVCKCCRNKKKGGT